MPVQRRHRSTVACEECRRRKVRCTVTVTGVPCIRCAQDRTPCTIQGGGHELPRSTLTAAARSDLEMRAIGNASSVDRSLPENMAHSVSPDSALRTNSRAASSYSQADSIGALGDATIAHSDPERQRDIDEEQTGAEISSAANRNAGTDAGVPFYTGEHPGVTAVIDVCAEQPMPRHILVRSVPPVSISQCDRDYLQQKGVFSLPQEMSQRELLHAYFHHVHPVFPILNAAILQDLENISNLHPSNLLLFWSMAVIAVNFVPSNVWRLEGFTSRKDMKDTVYMRAKCMYDNGGETDKLVLLQSALLLTFWHSDKDSPSQPWYWSGVAISLCQILGLHRDPDSGKYNRLFPLRRRHLWRRLWASCLFRDRWLSLTLGRPMRIRLSDCDMPLPTPDDVLSDLPEVPSPLIAKYIPQDLSRLMQYWSVLVLLNKLLGDVLLLCYQQLSQTPSLEQFQNLETELLQFHIPEVDTSRESRLVVFYYYHLQLHYRAILITFYRPFVSIVPQGLHAADEKSWQSRVRSQMEAAATYTNAILDNMAREDLVGFAGPMTPPLLVPAMHVHLLNCKSPNALTRKLGFNKLDLCMTVMRELQKTHTSASIFCGIFAEATRQLSSNRTESTDWRGATGSHSLSTTPQNDNNLDMPDLSSVPAYINEDVLQSLLSETSAYNFWESMNMPDQSFAGYGV